MLTLKKITADLSKQKALDTDSRAIQQIVFPVKIKSTVADTSVIIFYTLEQSKETILEFVKRNNKTVVNTCKWLNTAKQMLNHQIRNWKS